MLLVMSWAAFLAVRLIPGNPIIAMLGDSRASQQTIDNLISLHGLDLPLVKQFWNYFSGLLQGNLGISYFQVGKPVWEIISSSFFVTLKLTLMAFPVAVTVGITMGLAAAYYKDSWLDRLVSLFIVVATSIPQIAIGSFLYILFGLKLKWLPVAGWGRPAEAVLPVVLIALWPAASLAKLSRACILEEFTKQYITTAKAKGLSDFKVFFKHAFVNTLIPISTNVGLIFAFLLEGSFITEFLFNIPGLGRVVIDSIYRRDYPVIMASILLATFIYGLVNLVVDFGYWFFDPKLRSGEKYNA